MCGGLFDNFMLQAADTGFLDLSQPAPSTKKPSRQAAPGMGHSSYAAEAGELRVASVELLENGSSPPLRACKKLFRSDPSSLVTYRLLCCDVL